MKKKKENNFLEEYLNFKIHSDVSHDLVIDANISQLFRSLTQNVHAETGKYM